MEIKAKLDVLYNQQPPVKIRLCGLCRQSVTATKATKRKRTVLTLSHFFKATARAWKEGLPLTFAKRLRDFLSNQHTRVQINGENG